MKIKHLHIGLSLALFGLMTTSCLPTTKEDIDDSRFDDAYITNFELDTLVRGKSYKFTIDQERGHIYNEDSILPLEAKKLKKIKIKSINNFSGNIAIKLPSETKEKFLDLDTEFDLSNNATLISTALYGRKKNYELSIRVHRRHPDFLSWGKEEYIKTPIENAKQPRVVELGDEFYMFAGDTNKGAKTRVIPNATGSNVYYGKDWEQFTITTSGLKTENVVSYAGDMYAVNNEGKLFKSKDGVNWNLCVELEGKKVVYLLVGLEDARNAKIEKDGLAVVVEEDGQKYFAVTNKEANAWKDVDKVLSKVPAEFPTSSFSCVTRVLSNKVINAVCVGNGGEKFSVKYAWTTENGKVWVPVKSKEAEAKLKINNPSIIWYNDKYYMTGLTADGALDCFFSSKTLVDWKKEDYKFSIPGTKLNEKQKEEVNEEGVGSISIHNLEVDFAVKVDANNYIWLFTGRGGNSTWRGKLNKLSFSVK